MPKVGKNKKTVHGSQFTVHGKKLKRYSDRIHRILQDLKF
jgi:hypothetical protein